MNGNLAGIQRGLESITRRWWFVLLFILCGTILPPVATRGYEPPQTGEVIMHLLSHSFFASGALSTWYPVFKVAPIALIVALAVLGNRVGRIFAIYGGINYLLSTFLQGIAITDEYGLGIVTSNFITILIVALLWLWEGWVGQNDFTPQKRPLLRYWVVPLALLAFWYPVNLETMRPDFNPAYLFTNPAGLAFCTMTPAYLGMLTLYYPRVNIATLRVTSLTGTIIGFWNIIVNFVMKPQLLWWNGVLHLPLVFISIYALVLSFRAHLNTTKERGEA
ncbi:MAG: hypothetical protein N2508_10355 [Anaerolineae bacterium]|nr:hypothetical protein [Anaerolineae bacterium]